MARRNFINLLPYYYALLPIQGPTCFYCKCMVHKDRVRRGKTHSATFGTVDHLHPRRLGGKDYLGNLVIACKKCNEGKSGLSYDEMVGIISWGIS